VKIVAIICTTEGSQDAPRLYGAFSEEEAEDRPHLVNRTLAEVMLEPDTIAAATFEVEVQDGPLLDVLLRNRPRATGESREGTP
jgi:hypothetical protein